MIAYREYFAVDDYFLCLLLCLSMTFGSASENEVRLVLKPSRDNIWVPQTRRFIVFCSFTGRQLSIDGSQWKSHLCDSNGYRHGRLAEKPSRTKTKSRLRLLLLLAPRHRSFTLLSRVFSFATGRQPEIGVHIATATLWLSNSNGVYPWWRKRPHWVT